MEDRVKVALILAVAIVLGALLHGGIYEMQEAGSAPGAYKVNKFTGAVVFYGAGYEYQTSPKEWPNR